LNPHWQLILGFDQRFRFVSVSLSRLKTWGVPATVTRCVRIGMLASLGSGLRGERRWWQAGMSASSMVKLMNLCDLF
jgi:hypothetical protein